MPTRLAAVASGHGCTLPPAMMRRISAAVTDGVLARVSVGKRAEAAEDPPVLDPNPSCLAVALFPEAL